MRKRRILVAVHEDLVPPDSIDGLSDHEISDFRTEFDVVTGLKDLGHDVHCAGIGDELDALGDAMKEFEPHIVFNLIIEFLGAATYDQHVASYLELCCMPYTGCNPRGLTLARDKAVSKMILDWHGVPVPRFFVFPRGRRVRPPARAPYPLFVKSLTEEASLGISEASIVADAEALVERVEYIHDTIGTDAIVEEYVEGTEYYVGLLGNDRVQVFPPWELFIANLPRGAPNIATRRIKWDIDYQRALGVKNRRARGLGADKEREIARIARATHRALGLSGYARIDLRMRASDQKLFVLEVNPNPDVTFGEDFAEGAEAAGIGYEDLLGRIVRLGLAYPAEWKVAPAPIHS